MVRNGQTFTHQPYAGSNRLWKVTGAATRTLGYDDAGNLVSETGSLGTRAWTYDDFNRNAEYWLGGTLQGQYAHNAQNQRAWKSTASGTTRFVYAGDGRMLYEVGPGSASTAYVWIDRRGGLGPSHPRIATCLRRPCCHLARWRYAGRHSPEQPSTP